VFEKRRPATPEQIAQLIASFDAIGLDLEDAEVSVIATLAELGAMHTVLGIPNPQPGADVFYTIAELAPIWTAGGGSAHDREAYPRGLARVAAREYEPELLFAPTSLTSSDWWMIDAIHRAVAFYNTRLTAGVTDIGLRVFVMPLPLHSMGADQT